MMTRTESIGATFLSTAISWMTIDINPLLSGIASVFAIVLSAFLIYKTYLEMLASWLNGDVAKIQALGWTMFEINEARQYIADHQPIVQE
jgi:apolipoprotein N-acyltransferase